MDSQRKDRCLAYMACLLNSVIGWGIMQSFGTFLPYILDKYGETRSKTSIVHSVLIGVTLTTGVFSSALIKKCGTGATALIGALCLAGGYIASYFATGLTMLYATIGVVAGVGTSLTTVSSVVTTGRLFGERVQTAFLTILNVAGGVGAILFPYLSDWLLVLYGVNGAFLVLGGILLNTSVCAIIFYFSNRKAIYSDKQVTAADGKDESGVVKISLKSPTSVILLFFVPLAISNVAGLFAIFMDFLKFKQMSHSERLLCLVIYNVSSTLSRFLPILVNFCTNNPLFTLLITTTFGLVGSLILLFSIQIPFILVGLATIAVAHGAPMAATSVIAFKLFIPESQPFAFGLITTFMGLASTGMGPLYGGIYDVTKSYFYVMVVSSSIYLLCFICAAICIITYKRLQNKRDTI